jgi:hypothetical protein
MRPHRDWGWNRTRAVKPCTAAHRNRVGNGTGSVEPYSPAHRNRIRNRACSVEPVAPTHWNRIGNRTCSIEKYGVFHRNWVRNGACTIGAEKRSAAGYLLAGAAIWSERKSDCDSCENRCDVLGIHVFLRESEWAGARMKLENWSRNLRLRARLLGKQSKLYEGCGGYKASRAHFARRPCGRKREFFAAVGTHAGDAQTIGGTSPVRGDRS